MVNIERHEGIRPSDKPCLNTTDRKRKTCNICGLYACANGREGKHGKPNNNTSVTHQGNNCRCHSTAHAQVGNSCPGGERSYFSTDCTYSSSISSTSSKVSDDKYDCSKPPCQETIDQSLPYLEIPPEARAECSIETLQTNWLPHTPHSKTSLIGPRNFSVTVLCILFPVLLMCKCCVCHLYSDNHVSCDQEQSSNPSYLTLLNGTVLPPLSGQCLSLTTNLVDDICEIPLKASHNRMLLLRKTSTNFCGLPLVNILSKDEIKRVTQCSRDRGCARVLRAVEELDSELSDMYCHFTDVLARIDCGEMFQYSLGNCSRCKEAYKQWLCSVYHTYYYNDAQIKPCIEFCDHVSESCPFFRPYGDTLIGEPGFLCKDSKSFLPADTSVVYGPSGCCYKPCFVTSGSLDCPNPGNTDCPESNSTFNLTNQTNSACAVIFQGRSMNSVISVFLACFLSSLFTQNVQIIYKSIGLT
ncbi:uncharacterized protein LOC128220460 [Mya arenaria]|uniref:uncharacterized protein LOC128220460 n=1 Tax=Mya arenaria TaxID=6604 RepID=UPI0022E44763|nr:uncharacterized protein LOC128220460 [Mya arenaria]XP_052784829.1 uncharacterized protein LOC128220460 [Mya arenaria]